MNFYQQYEEMPHRKRAKRKTVKKSRHRHNFQPCVFEFEGIRYDKNYGFVTMPDASIGTYCPICGKIGSFCAQGWRQWKPLNASNRGGSFTYTDIAKKELNPQTRTLPTFHLRDKYSQKNVKPPTKYGI